MSTPPISSPPLSTTDLYAILTTILKTHPLTIEILPSSLPLPPNSRPFLYQDHALGIPKRTLISAFLIARQIFFSPANPHSFPSSLPTSTHHHDPPPPPSIPPFDLQATTRLLLLYDPEHLTAANARKRHLLQTLSSLPAPPSNANPPNQPPLPLTQILPATLITSELTFLTSLQTSPLHRHAKSSTLWWHRFWVVKTFHGVLFPKDSSASESLASQASASTQQGQQQQPSTSSIDAAFDGGAQHLEESFWAEEIKVVLAAADRHKCNYHAFLYARRLLEFLPRIFVSEDVVSRLHTFCLVHPRDISAWTFLAFLLERGMHGGRSLEARGMGNRVVWRTEGFIRDLAWKGASVDWFLRAMGAGSGVGREPEESEPRTREDDIG